MYLFNFVGADLAKLVTKSILLLENIGGKVVGITSEAMVLQQIELSGGYWG